MRRGRGPLLAGVVLLAAGCGGGSGDPGTDPAQPGRGLPETPVGERVDQVFDALGSGDGLDAQTYEELFGEAFRAQVPLSTLAPLAGAGLQVRDVRLGQAPNYLTADAVVSGIGEGVLSAALAGTGRLSQFAVAADPAPVAPVEEDLDGWTAVEERLAGVAPRVGLLAAELGEDGCVPVREVAAQEVRPLGSTFKLLVLDALAEAVAEGDLTWERELTVTDRLRTLPSGVLQDGEGEVTITVADAAALMISISDNTATDLLLGALGRDRVKQHAEAAGLAMATLRPFLSTAELFRLRLEDHPALAERYQDAGVAQRRELLGGEDVAEETPPLATIEEWTAPRWEGEPGWQASAADLCALLAALDERSGADGVVGEVLGLSDGGLALDPGTWSDVGFKGGSEVGVVNLVHRAERADGTAYVVAVMAADPAQALPQEATGELLAISRAAYALLAQE